MGLRGSVGRGTAGGGVGVLTNDDQVHKLAQPLIGCKPFCQATQVFYTVQSRHTASQLRCQKGGQRGPRGTFEDLMGELREGAREGVWGWGGLGQGGNRRGHKEKSWCVERRRSRVLTLTLEIDC